MCNQWTLMIATLGMYCMQMHNTKYYHINIDVKNQTAYAYQLHQQAILRTSIFINTRVYSALAFLFM